MSEEQPIKRERDPLPQGPWSHEPNRLQWVDPATNLDCLIVRNDLGALCGYVGVPKGHRFYEVEENDVPYEDIHVHGGLTYSNHCQGHICHEPEPGRPDDVWWLGFDCAHHNDLVPGMDRAWAIGRGHIYRDLNYVKEQCANLAQQLTQLNENRG